MKRAQAALEYLVTYGWGFVAIIVVIGAMAYFGFLDPGRYLPSRCDFGSQLECVDFRLEDNSAYGSNGCALLQVVNGFGDDIRIYGIQTVGGTGAFEPDSTDCTDDTAIPSGSFEVVEKGNLSRIMKVVVESADTDVFLAEGERQSVRLIVDFSRDLDGAPRHNVTGEIFATVGRTP